MAKIGRHPRMKNNMQNSHRIGTKKEIVRKKKKENTFFSLFFN